jgi:hypothetical protein
MFTPLNNKNATSRYMHMLFYSSSGAGLLRFRRYSVRMQRPV